MTWDEYHSMFKDKIKSQKDYYKCWLEWYLKFGERDARTS